MEVKKQKKTFDIKVILVIATAIAWLITGIFHFTESLEVKIPFIVTLLITIVTIVSFFFKKFAEKFDKKSLDEIPEPLSEEKIRTKLNGIIKKRFNYIEGEPTITPNNINKNQIYSMKVNLEMPERFGDKYEYSCWVLINATYPKIMPCIREGSLSEEKIKDFANNMSMNPKDDPDEEETITENAFTGTKQVTKKTIHPKEIKEEEKEV